MLSNKIKISSESLKNLVCPAILLIYAIGVAVIFFYFLKFITQNINLALAPAFNQEALEKSVQLDLENYQFLAAKLRWETPLAPLTPGSSSLPSLDSSPLVASSSLDASILPEEISSLAAAAATRPENNLTTSTLDIPATGAGTAAAPAIFQKSSWKISIVNSTTRNGLAGELKKRLEAVGYQVVKIGNQKNREANTIVGLKAGLDRKSPEIIEINQIVSEKYNFTVATLVADNAYDIEIIIGDR